MIVVFLFLYLFTCFFFFFFFFSSRRRHTRYWRDWSSDVCSSDLPGPDKVAPVIWGMDVFVSRRSWLSWGQVLDLMQEGNVCALRLRRSAALTHHTTAV